MSACSACGDDRCDASLGYDQADAVDYFDAALEAAPMDPDFRYAPGQLDLFDRAPDGGI